MERSILIVDNDLETKLILARLIAHADSSLRVVWATTAEEADSLLQTEKIALVLADWRLGYGASGLDLWRICKDRDPRVGFILMSAFPFTSDSHGAQSPLFLKKPFSAAECRAKIKQAFTEQTSQGERL